MKNIAIVEDEDAAVELRQHDKNVSIIFITNLVQYMGDMMLVNGGSDVEAAVFYDEGIYVGYKYYETRYYDKTVGQGNAGDYDYSQVVQYPFGYGLSYTTFEWSGFQMGQMNADGDIEIKVTVKNTGSVAGKEVVQVYLNAPYTDYDKANHIEKSAASLVGFEKTGEIAPGGSETVTVAVNQKDFVSYDDVQAKTYILEAGDYLLTAAPNVHAAVNNFLAYDGQEGDGLFGTADAEFVGVWNYSYSQNGGVDNVTYAKSLTGVDVTNQFDHAHYDEFTARDQFLTRQDWEGTFPVTHGNQDSKRTSPFSEKNGCTWEVEVSDAIRDAIRAKGVGASMNPMTEEEAAAMAGVYGKKGDLELTGFEVDAPLDVSNPASQYFSRQAIKHILYTTVNSNAMNGIVHGTAVGEPPFANYHFILIAEWVAAAALTAWGVVAIVRRWKNEKKA